MATKFTFPRNSKIGDRIEIVSTSIEKLPINIVGNPEAGKNLVLIFPNQTYSNVADGETVVTTITEQNIIYGFRCVSITETHTWLLEGSSLYPLIDALTQRIVTLEGQIQSLTQRVIALESLAENQPVEGKGE